MSFRSASLKEPKNKNSKRKRETNGHIEDESTPTENGAQSSQPSTGENKKRKKKKWELRTTDFRLELFFKNCFDVRSTHTT